MKVWLLGDLSYLIRENRMFKKNSRINYFCVIGCADHCVYVGVGTPNLYLGGRVVVGSAFYEILWGLCLVIIRTTLLVMWSILFFRLDFVMLGSATLCVGLRGNLCENLTHLIPFR
jgi:hypothetical protein